MFNSEIVTPPVMAKAKTGSFYLTESVIIPAASGSGTRVQGTIDLGAYVEVSSGIAVAIESVDFITQGDSGGDFQATLGTMCAAGNMALGAQLTDLNPGSLFVRADNQSLVASSQLQIDRTNNVGTHTNDLFPDNFGPSNLSEAFLVVNDQLYLVAGNDNDTTGAIDIAITARIKCKIVKLSTVDWMAIAIQSTAADN